MTGAIVQLVSKGYESFFIVDNPQISFFKIVYRRHTNFATEQIRLNFEEEANFGKTLTAKIAKNADILGNVVLKVTLPAIKQIDNITKFAWVPKIGLALIKHVSIQLNGIEIDRHYGEWLNLWYELTGCIRGGEKKNGFNKMIGNIPELYNFTSSKSSYSLYIPLQFWFCKDPGSYLPLSALSYTDVKISVELNDVNNCYLISPTNYITTYSDIVNFTEGEYIQQNISTLALVPSGIFHSFDIITKKLYYFKISLNEFTSIQTTASSQSEIEAVLAQTQNQQYLIVGNTSKYECFPDINTTESTYSIQTVRNLKLLECYLIADYHYLDDSERNRFMTGKHDYLIEQLYFTPNYKIIGGRANVNVKSEQPCKLILWVNQYDYIYQSGDYFNYTNSYIKKKFDTEYPDYNIGDCVGSNTAVKQAFTMNGKTCISTRPSEYFEEITSINYFDYMPAKGSNCISFALYPTLSIPSGSCNFSQIELAQIEVTVGKDVSSINFVNCRSYCLCYNILRISYGFAAPIFIH